MKLLHFTVFVLVSTAIARADVVFEGFMVRGDRPLFVLSSESAGSSGWISIGQQFENIAIVDFDPRLEILTVEQDHKQHQLKMRESKVRAETPVDPKARLRSLQGTELAYEVAKYDTKVMYLLGRYHGALESLAKGHPVEQKVDAYRSELVDAAKKKAKELLSEK